MAPQNPKNSRRKGKSSSAGPKLNVNRCPEDMSLEDWQRALRRHIAAKETFGVQPPVSEGDPFIVHSPKSGRSYRVEYFGAVSPLNRCECMDFKTSRLGTCKHIEAISLDRGGRHARRGYAPPAHTSVYVDYVDSRKVKIRRGTAAPDAILPLISALFDDGVIRDMETDPSGFIREARRLDPGFEWETDAMNLLIETRDRCRRRRIIAEKYAGSYFDGLLRTTLHPYQADGVRFAFAGGRTINADEMGLGKTVQAIATAELLRREGMIESVIIICPTSLKYQWLAEIRRFTDSPALVVEGNLMKRREQFRDKEYFYKICSFHSVTNNIKTGHIPQADMIIYDELQRLKNKDTQMGRQLRKLQSQYVLALSGTPLENKLDELYSVTQLVDQYVLGPYYRFTADTTLTDDSGKLIGYRNLHAVAERLRDTLIRRRKADVRLQMPARTDTNLFVPMTKEQRAIHEEYKFNVATIIQKWHRQRFLSEADRKRLLLFLSMMRMVCDSTFILDQKTRHDTKIDEVMAIVQNLLADRDGKVVIFSQWERMLRILSLELKEEEIDFCFLHGGVPSPKRKDLIDRFRDDPDCRVFLSTDAGATGLNLQTASLLINIDLPWNPAVLEQRIARIYRLGQENPVQIINMVASDTIEEKMLATLKFKSDLAAGILDNGDDAIFVENRKFDRIVETVEAVLDHDTPADPSVTETPAESPESTAPTAPAESTPTDPAAPAESTPTGNTSASSNNSNSSNSSDNSDPSNSSDSSDSSNYSNPSNVRDLVSGSLSALGKIAEVLKTPEGPNALADALVKEDPATGQTTLDIPVPDKATVVNIFSAFASLLNRT